MIDVANLLESHCFENVALVSCTSLVLCVNFRIYLEQTSSLLGLVQPVLQGQGGFGVTHDWK